MPRRKKIQIETSEVISTSVNKTVSISKMEQSSSKLGDILKKARMQKHIKIPSISKKLKIKEIYLEALEEGHYYSFPALVYGIGFLRSYAIYLGLNPEEMIALFHHETTTIKEEPLDMPRSSDPKMMPSFKVIGACLGVFFCLYLIINIIRVMTHKPTEVKLPVENPTPVAEQQVVASEQPIAEPVTTVVESVPEKPREVKIYGLKTPARVSFVANQEVWIEVRDSETKKMLLGKNLKKGDQYNPESDAEGLLLKTMRPEALDVYVDGQLQPKLTLKKTRKGVSLLPEDLMKE